MAIDHADRTVVTQESHADRGPGVGQDGQSSGQDVSSDDLERQSQGTPNSTHVLGEVRTSVAQRVSGAMHFVSAGATTINERLPGTVRATRAGAHRTTTALQRLPDSTLRWLTAGSVGLAAGLKLAGAPRLVTAAGAAPALIMGAAIALRRTEPAVQIEEHADESAEGMIDMTDEHTKGAISKTTGTIEEGLGRLTGDKEQQAHGKAKQVQGDAQKVLGDVQDAIREPKDQAKDGA
jgi:uncharacterized protein YjbJ (UPF0337 family)